MESLNSTHANIYLFPSSVADVGKYLITLTGFLPTKTYQPQKDWITLFSGSKIYPNCNVTS